MPVVLVVFFRPFVPCLLLLPSQAPLQAVRVEHVRPLRHHVCVDVANIATVALHPAAGTTQSCTLTAHPLAPSSHGRNTIAAGE